MDHRATRRVAEELMEAGARGSSALEIYELVARQTRALIADLDSASGARPELLAFLEDVEDILAIIEAEREQGDEPPITQDELLRRLSA